MRNSIRHSIVFEAMLASSTPITTTQQQFWVEQIDRAETQPQFHMSPIGV
jgi:hypothetical protein